MNSIGSLTRRTVMKFLLISVLLVTPISCTNADSHGRVQSDRSAEDDVTPSVPRLTREQLVVPVGRHYVRLTPGSNRPPTRILPTRQMRATAIASAGNQIYWLHRDPKSFANSIRSVSNSGRNPTIMVPRVSKTSFTLAATRRHVFLGSALGVIDRVSVGSGRVQRRWLKIQRGIAGITTHGRFLYVSQCFQGRIGRIALAASRPQVEWIVDGISGCPQALTVTPRFVFWAGYVRSGQGVVGSAPVAGGSANETWRKIGSFAGPGSFAVAGGFVYWDWGGTPSSAPSFIGRASLDGSRFTRKFLTVGPGPITTTQRPSD